MNKTVKLFTQEVSRLLFFLLWFRKFFKYMSNLLLLFPLFEMDFIFSKQLISTE